MPLIEQIILSGANFLFFLLLARNLSREQWGTYSLAYALFLFLQGFQRALVVIPFSTTVHGREAVLEQGAVWWRRHVLVTFFCVAAAGLTSAVSYALSDRTYWLTEVSAVTAMMLVPLFFQEFLRRWFVQIGESTRLIPLAVVYGVVIVPIAFWQASSHVSAIYIAATVGALLTAAFLVPVMLVIARARKSCSRDLHSVAHRIPFEKARWNVLSHLAYAGYTTGIQIMLTALGSVSAQAVFGATRNLVQPLNVLMAALDTVDKPRASAAYKAHGWAGLWSVMRRTFLFLGCAGGLYLILAAFLGETAMRWLYAGKYDDVQTELLLWVLCYLVMMLTVPLETAQYVLHRTDALFGNRLVAMAVGVCLAALTIPILGAKGALLGWGAAWLACASMSVRQLYVLHREARS